MKRMFLSLALVMGLSLSVMADDIYERDDSSLPQPAKNTLSKHFNDKVSLVKIDKDFGRIDEYEVILDNGTEVKFDRKGNWKSVETPANKSVPKGLIPEAMGKYVKENHKGAKIVSLEKERSKYEVELSNGMELEFDLSGNFLRYDD